MIKKKHTQAPLNNKTWSCRCGAINNASATECKRISIDKMNLTKSIEAGRWVGKKTW